MSKYWSTYLNTIEAYVPGEQPKDKTYIKLNTNENPYPPSPNVLRAIKNAVNEDLRLYPDPCCDELRSAIAKYYGVKMDEVFVGNGSDEVLAFSFAAFFDNELPILFPDITYSFYPVYSDFFRLNFIKIEVNSDFSIQTEKFLVKNGGIIIPNPNAPTSTYLPIDQIKKILDYNLSIEKVVVIDEAYIDFGGESIISLVDKYPNLLVIQTLSKSRALAGLRIGFAIGNKELIDGLDRVKSSINSYTLDRLAIVGATEAFKDEEYFRKTKDKILQTRKWVSDALQKIGFTVMNSASNFLFISHSNFGGADLYKKLREHGVLVRYFNKPGIENYLRVSIGTDGEMEKFVEILKQIIN